MATLHSKIEQYVGRKVDFIEEVMIHSEGGKEPYIGSWNVEGKTKPTDAQLKALETKAAEVDAENACVASQSRCSAWDSVRGRDFCWCPRRLLL